MKTNFLLSIIAAAAMSIPPIAARAGVINYSYGQSDELYFWGLSAAQTYDIAIKLGPEFAGVNVSSISVPVTVTPNITDFKVWMTSQLAIETVDGKKVNRTDIMCQDLKPVVASEDDLIGYLSYTLPESYSIPEEGLYVGYSFTVDKRENEYEQYPVLVTIPGVEGVLYVHSTRTYRAWKDRALEVDAVSAITVGLEADFADNAVSVSASSDLFATAGQSSEQVILISNKGLKQVESIGYTLSINGADYQGEYVFEEPIPDYFNRSDRATITVPALGLGVYDYSIVITTVNGQPNAVETMATGVLHSIEVLPVKRPLMEEYTGTWCGWCPRGWVAMEKMSELHKDFVAIAYHNQDKMEMPGYPRMENGYPSAFMDRSISCDPYYGSNNEEFGIEALWQELGLGFSPAEIQLEAIKSVDGTTVTVTSDVFWAVAPEAGTYKVEYVLVGDGLSDVTWVQSNNYASYAEGSAGIYMDIFCNGGEYGKSRIPGLVYNDVALINSGGIGVDGSIEDLSEGSHNTYTYTFDLSKSAVIDKAQELRVVAMILKDNGQFGKVINANKAEVVTDPAGIESLNTDTEIVDLKYYDLTGRQIQNPVSGGIYIRKATFASGRTETVKLVK